MSITPWGWYGREVTAQTSHGTPAARRAHLPWSAPCWLRSCRSRSASGRLGLTHVLADRVARAQAAVCTEDWRWPQTGRLAWAFSRAGVVPTHSRIQTATLQIEHQSSYVAFKNSFLTCRNDWCTLAPVERHRDLQPGTKAQRKPRPSIGQRLFYCTAQLPFRRAVWGLPRGGAGPFVRSANPTRSATIVLQRW